MKNNKFILGLIFLILVVPFVFAADIGYIVDSSTDSSIVTIINDLGYTYEVIDGDDVSGVDFTDYSMLLIGEGTLSDYKDIPVRNMKSLIVSCKNSHIDEWGIADYMNPFSSNDYDYGDVFRHSISSSWDDSIKFYNTKSAEVCLLPDYPGNRASGLERLIVSESSGRIVAGIIEPEGNLYGGGSSEESIIYFGIPETNYWTLDTKNIFSDSIDWLIGEANIAPTLTNNIGTLEWNEGGELIINFNNYFEDHNGDDLTYSIHETSDKDEITITISNNLVRFTSIDGWFGEDWVIFKASDGEKSVLSNNVLMRVLEHSGICEDLDLDGYDNCNPGETGDDGNPFDCDDSSPTINPGTLEICNNIDDNCDGLIDNGLDCVEEPEILSISSYTPNVNSLKILNGDSQSFSVVISDPTASVEWFMDSIFVGMGWSYDFKEGLGNYNLKAVVDDGNSTVENLWSFSVNNIQDLTCSEANSFICSETQSCSQDFLNTISPRCCPVTCTKKPLEFNDIDREDEITNDLEFEIKDPDENEEFLLGDTLRVKLDIDNNVDDNLDIEIKISLYDLTEDEVVEEYESTTEINEESSRIINTDIILPYDIEEDNNFALFIQINDEDEEYFNEGYIEINLDRKEKDVIIKKIETPEQIYCGDNFNTQIKLQNIGSEEQGVGIKIQSSKLDIDEEIELFALDAYDEKDTITKDFNLKIPQDATKDIYPLKITVNFGGKRITEEKQIVVDCTEINTLNINEIKTNGDNSSANIPNKPSKTLIIFMLILTSILTLGLIGTISYMKIVLKL
ncbi:hypothetical protein HOE04_04365 [archaeon]|nr:hypothetical protein [archaeon]